MNKEIKPLTIDDIRKLKGYARSEALRKYQLWKKKNLLQEKVQAKRETNRIYARKKSYKLKNSGV